MSGWSLGSISLRAGLPRAGRGPQPGWRAWLARELLPGSPLSRREACPHVSPAPPRPGDISGAPGAQLVPSVSQQLRDCPGGWGGPPV